ncbi:hypothetical protein XOC_1409 [Xanthomonas oryzae pv. oryzicola BLS256]|uniref:Uncharacterized protein n=1 Tax=Xanthomonas oryzae pv. oryzicola (strain BLS256) TaxID=383407 RepID=G7TI71_XANOB|nr:hypothetical protein XOC_1409 [Xanthomonas oryzae pv. oryzicola BLS256]
MTMLSIAKNARAGKPQGSNALRHCERKRVRHQCALPGQPHMHRQRACCSTTRLRTASEHRRNNRLQPPSCDGGRRATA